MNVPGGARTCISKVFVDTNILVYTCDRSEPKKQREALEVLDRLVLTASGVISTQVLAEFNAFLRTLPVVVLLSSPRLPGHNLLVQS